MMEREHLELLTSVAQAFPGRQIVTIGAEAFRWHYAAFRGTLDLDLCIAIDLEEHGRSGMLPDGWTRVQAMPHRWRLPDGQLLDIIPAADELLAAGAVRLPGGMTMDLTGIDLAMRDHERYADELPVHVGVASRRALFVTKVAAWLDRPDDRAKDLGDIALLLEEYVDDDEPRRFDDPLLEGLDWNVRPSFLLGMDLRAICDERHEERIREFVARIGDPTRREHSWMLDAGAAHWRGDTTALPSRLRSLLDGLGAS